MKKQNARQQRWSATIANLTIGIDVGDRSSVMCGIEREGQVTVRRTFEHNRTREIRITRQDRCESSHGQLSALVASAR